MDSDFPGVILLIGVVCVLCRRCNRPRSGTLAVVTIVTSRWFGSIMVNDPVDLVSLAIVCIDPI